MQGSDAKCCVGVPMRVGFVSCFLVMVGMDVDVLLAVVFVFVRVDVEFERFPQRPEANAEQHHADQPFAPGRN